MLYYFKLSNDMAEEEVEVVLHSENGQFKVLMALNFIPTDDNFTLKGDERSPLVFKVPKDSENQD